MHDPGYLVELRQCEIVIANILRLTGDNGVGFDIGLRTELCDLGILGYAAQSCKTMRDTFRVWARYSNPLVGVMSKLTLDSEAPNSFSFRIVQQTPSPAVYAFCVEELLGMLHAIGRLLSGEVPRLMQVSLSYPPPPHRRRYRDLLKCPVRFGADLTTVEIASCWADLPLRTTDNEFYKLCVQHCSQVLHQIENGSPLASRLRDIFLQNPQDIPKLSEAARVLGLSARTLKRHLQKEGTSYQKLVDGFRRDLAAEYLRSTGIAPKEIAYLLGFKDQSSFRRAFKSWTGKTVTEFRALA
ncbi:MAG: AraC family transcriptional regulator ligand-binding domain-containing protein [Gammaproteobacteria bacterium]